MDVPLPKRKKLRLPNYDYSLPGAYFVTICTEGRRGIFGSVRRGDPCGRPPQVELTPLGVIAQATFCSLESKFCIQIPVFIVMPDHIHAIFMFQQRATARVAPTLGRVVGAYKSMVATQWLMHCKQNDVQMGKLWQRGYYEHVLRNQTDVAEAAAYVADNPARWAARRQGCVSHYEIL